MHFSPDSKSIIKVCYHKDLTNIGMLEKEKMNLGSIEKGNDRLDNRRKLWYDQVEKSFLA